jgi:arginyl-tRNA synthetase
MIKQRLVELLTLAIHKAQKAGKIPMLPLPDVMVERPQNPDHGDFASNIAMKLSRHTGLKPLLLAQYITSFINPSGEITHAKVAPPGFINFFLKSDWLTSQVNVILDAGQLYGNINLGHGSKIQVEFVSVNPTGPLHVGHGRGAVLGSSLANILTAAGYHVQKEYYINDAGNQIEAFTQSLYARCQQALGIDTKMPEDGYVGNYLIDLAKEIIDEEESGLSDLMKPAGLPRLKELGLKKTIEKIKNDLELLGVTFDNWFSERSLFNEGKFNLVMSLLQQQGSIKEKDGATWFAAGSLNNNKDNVLLKSDGSPTYFATDVAYHYNKFLERNFDHVIDIWGADHQGHVPRMKTVMEIIGVPSERLRIIISQMVTLRRGRELVKISKRSGDIITLREVIDEVGSDACRFFFLSRSANAQMDFDLDLAIKESPDNPVYYVQYAHARIASILRLANERNIKYYDGDASQLTSLPELTLIRKMLMLPEIIETAVMNLEPHHLTYYAQDLAAVFHSFYKQCRVISANLTLSKARLKLVEAAKITLTRTLHLMGIQAPESM